MSSKKIATDLQNKYFYFSPYADESKISDPNFKEMYKYFNIMLSQKKWANQTSKNDFKITDQEWQKIKLKQLSNQENFK